MTTVLNASVSIMNVSVMAWKMMKWISQTQNKKKFPP